MKIITWNCNMAFRKKADFILAHKPDILIVPECEHPDKLKFNIDTPKPTDILWFGDNQYKGLGIFSYSKFRFKLRKTHNPRLKIIIPIAVTGGNYDFTLYAIWANNPSDPDGQYVEQVWKAIRHYDKHLTNKTTILIGDFNSNTIWDRKYREGNHSNVVKALEDKGIYSTYHLLHKQEQGKEQHPTLYMYRHKDKPYHIDYCFASKDIAGKIESVEIGDFDFWSQYSDHVPVIITFN
ncbi:MAG TPA: endonuclease/exonuclease/phosphatase family protein [Chitinophagaceae bacterium]|nr:endonuclease/exonuclease/phosphatase family protein [Chitinophagaceae bacterium]